MFDKIQSIYDELWGKPFEVLAPLVSDEVLKDFPKIKIALYAPTQLRPFWTYATVGLSEISLDSVFPVELHMLASEKSRQVLETISAFLDFAVSHSLKPQEIFSLNQPAEVLTKCKHLYLSYPCLDGEGFPELFFNQKEIHFLWIVPITDEELRYLNDTSPDMLEEKFLEFEVDFANWDRNSLIS